MSGPVRAGFTRQPVPDISTIAAKYDRVALVLQGGGALGAYQAGVYQALAEANCDPKWIAGVSIGAVNSALIAGNPREKRLAALEDFWSKVSDRKVWAYTPEGDFFRDLRNQTSAMMAMAMGQPGFFKPRPINPWLAAPGAEGATSFYDTSELHSTLERLVDFDRINAGETRLSVGAVNVRTGNFVYFDSEKLRLGPEHIMASGALPPALPPVKIECELYWDGGIVSNTPLQHLLDQDPQENSLVFQVDLFSARGPAPRRIADVLSRHKDISYSSRTRQNTDTWARVHNLKVKLLEALRRVPEANLSEGEKRSKRSDRAGWPHIHRRRHQGRTEGVGGGGRIPCWPNPDWCGANDALVRSCRSAGAALMSTSTFSLMAFETMRLQTVRRTSGGTERPEFVRSRRLLRFAHDVSAARSVCASAISGSSGVGEKPLSADASKAWASVSRSVKVIELRQRERRAQLKTARLLLLRDGDCSEQCILGPATYSPERA